MTFDNLGMDVNCRRICLILCSHFNILVISIVLEYQLIEESPIGTVLGTLKDEEEVMILFSKSLLEDITFSFLDRSEKVSHPFKLNVNSDYCKRFHMTKSLIL